MLLWPIQVVGCIHFFLLLSTIPSYEWTRLCLIIHPLKDIQVIYNSELLWIKLCCHEHSCTGFCVDKNFYFSEMNVQEYNHWVMWQVQSFIRNCQTVFQMAETFYSPSSSIWENTFCTPLPAFGITTVFCCSPSNAYSNR